MFHSCQFHAPVMSPFFRPHEPFNVTLDDIRPRFHLPRYPTDGESDSDICLTLMYSMESDPSESSYPTYSVELDPSESSYTLVIRLSSDSSSSPSANPTPPLVRGHGFIGTYTIPRGCGDDAPSGFRNGYLPFDG